MSPAPLFPQDGALCERRRHQRFPVKVATHFVISEISGEATVRNLSSGGVFLETGTVLPAGGEAVLHIRWPAPLGKGHRIKLRLIGRVVRSNEFATAIEISRYSFEFSETATVTRVPNGRNEAELHGESLRAASG